jgi:hypothetical protein
VELSFVAAVQDLLGTQRVDLLLRDVLEFPSVDVARILDTTPAAVNSALATRSESGTSPDARQEATGRTGCDRNRRSTGAVEAFMRAWERADGAALVDLPAADARFTMPPLPAWFLGRNGIGRFFDDRMLPTPWRLVPRRANAQPAFAGYQAISRAAFARRSTRW